MEPYFRDRDIVIFNEDCRDVLRSIRDNSVVVLTDFPYGIGVEYEDFDDSKEELQSLIDDVMPDILRVGIRAAITCGTTNIHMYPQPRWAMSWFNPAGAGIGPWGFTCWQPILVYGEDPYLQNGMGARPDAMQMNETGRKTDHPCPKPTGYWSRLLERISVDKNEIIFDPFMGSGTTLMVARNAGHRAIGVEISERYCMAAVRDLAQASMFTSGEELDLNEVMNNGW